MEDQVARPRPAVLALRRRSATGPDAVQWRDARDGALLTLVAVALLVASVATSMYEQRYGLPTLPLFCVAAGLAWSALTRPRQRDAGTPAHG